MKSLDLFIVDPQRDFCDPEGALSVPGADKDMESLAKLIRRLGDHIRAIHCTLDAHHFFDISHPAFWTDSRGKHPESFTIIRAEDVGTGVWRTGQNAEMLGLDVNSIRLKAVLLSTLIACAGQIVFIQNIGMMNVYTAHLNSDIFSCTAILAGGATIRNARIRHAFIVSPQAGQNIFRNPAFGEYFRSFAAYGTIAFALIYSTKASAD